MINFGIDLGTTNSSIAKFEKGQVVVFKNPLGQKDTLPSVVAFRNGRIIVGEKAREYLRKAPDQVAGSFKRKMGTSETLMLAGEAKTPIELSAQVLKELKTFVHTGEVLEAAVITIPASFDTIQSNATKEAGYLAGFEQVVLLQEPIAASLAYANQDETDDFGEGQWLVYDLGGGTFDVALIRIQDGEMKVMDHEGDNFLGGTDFDKLIVEQLLIPYLEEAGTFTDLLQEMRSAGGRYNSLYQKLLNQAEEAKVELSTQAQAEIEFETEDEDGNMIEGFFTLEREAFEALLEPYLEKTLLQIRAILSRNELSPEQLKFVLLVGGSTYIPFIREQVGERLGIPVNTRVDPTTAVAVGAAFYAGTKTRRKTDEAGNPREEQLDSPLEIRTAYQKATQEDEEYFTATFEGSWEGLYYRIIRSDGGYDSGLKLLSPQIKEYLPLVKNSFNQFELLVFDEKNTPVPINVAPIGITQGRYSVVGQPLPNDICIEIDDVENDTTVLDVIFAKNSVLPVKRTLVKQITRTIAKGSSESLVITVVEGPGTALPAANQPIGFISISGEQLTRDLVRGSDVEITLEMSESRDLSINAYLMMTDQEFEDVFTPSARRVNLSRLIEELHTLAEKIRAEISEAEDQGNFETAQEMVDMEFEILEVADKAKKMRPDDVTDDKFQIEALKRKVAQKVDELTRDKFIIRIKSEYFELKRDMETVLENFDATEKDESDFGNLLDLEKETLATNSSLKIREYMDQILRLNWRVRWNSSKYIRNFFQALCFGMYGGFSDAARAEQLITEGRKAIQEDQDDKLRVIINQLCELLPPAQKKQVRFGGTGIG